MANSRYLNANQREDIYWIGALSGYLEPKTKHYTDKALVWMNSILFSCECFLREQLDGIEEKERRAIYNTISGCTPTIQLDKIAREGVQEMKVDADTLYSLGDIAITVCRFDCKKDYATCERREMFLKLGIPPVNKYGACQYETDGVQWEGEE